MISFGIFYYYIGTTKNGHFSMEQTMTPLDALYLSIVTQTTVGYGDISCKTTPGKLFSCFIAISGAFLMALVVTIVTGLSELEEK